MSIFKRGPKRFNDVAGYERISRLIEDRQRQIGGDALEEEDLEEETVLLSPQPRAPREPAADDVSFVRPTEPPAVEPVPTSAPQRPPELTPTIPAMQMPPRMPVPDLPATAANVTLVSKDAVWDGKLNCTGDVRIEGVMQGEVETTGTLYVAAEARVNGAVRATNVLLAGEMDGQLRCEERLEILPGGTARGEIDTGSLVVHEGAYIESKFQMRRGPAGAARA